MSGGFYNNTVSPSGGTGTGLTVDLRISWNYYKNWVARWNIVNRGTGYKVGDTITAQGPSCVGGRVCFYRRNKIGSNTPSPTWGVKTLVKCEDTDIGRGTMEFTTADMDHWYIAEGSCPDPGSEDGYGTPTPIGEVGPIEPDISSYTYVRWVGTKTKNRKAGKFFQSSNSDGTHNYVDVVQDFEVTNIAPGWMTFNNYVTIGGG